jgi:hypothetical protein
LLKVQFAHIAKTLVLAHGDKELILDQPTELLQPVTKELSEVQRVTLDLLFDINLSSLVENISFTNQLIDDHQI